MSGGSEAYEEIGVALPWVRLDTSFPMNPKLLAMLGEKDGYRAATVYLCGLAYSGLHGTDGFITGAALPFVHGRKTDADRLVRYGFWHSVSGGWQTNDWAEFQQTTGETRERRERSREWSARANCVRWHGKGCGCWRGSANGAVPAGSPGKDSV